LAAFVDNFDEIAAGILSPEDLVPELLLDGTVQPADITLQLVRGLGCLAPHGMGNPEPVFLLEGVRVLSSRAVKGQHLKLAVQAGGLCFDAIGFNMAGIEGGADLIDLAFTPELNRWKGRESLQLRLRGLRVREGGAC
jgi:single-stranded-DNA-specific exonuclease